MMSMGWGASHSPPLKVIYHLEHDASSSLLYTRRSPFHTTLRAVWARFFVKLQLYRNAHTVRSVSKLFNTPPRPVAQNQKCLGIYIYIYIYNMWLDVRRGSCCYSPSESYGRREMVTPMFISLQNCQFHQRRLKSLEHLIVVLLFIIWCLF